MITYKDKFNKAINHVLNVEGISIVAGGELYIRSLEGNSWAVGTLDRFGDIDTEKVFDKIEEALIDFHKINDKNGCSFD